MTKPKLLLIHGWDYANYTSTGCTDAWSRRTKFIDALKRRFDVVTPNLPGFCGTPDPQKPWKLDDYVDYVDSIIAHEHPDAILGYSFGGAVALHWKEKTKDMQTATFLVSPAIIRRYEKKDLGFVKKVLKNSLSETLISPLRDLYLTFVVKNPFYSKATGVMRATYRNIVAVDLRDELMSMKSPVTLIYGEKDTATPPDLVRTAVAHAKAKHRLRVIIGGGHDIANSHTNELMFLIEKEMRDGNGART